MSFESKLTEVRAIITDVDGVLTDGSIFMTPQGEGKQFSVVDGMGFKLAEKCGLKTAVLTGRRSKALELRVQELGIAAIRMGRLDKQTALTELCTELELAFEDVVYIGDDLPDLAPIQLARVGFCPLDARDEIKRYAQVVPVPGGKGVLRWVVEAILKAQDQWDHLVASFEVKHD